MGQNNANPKAKSKPGLVGITEFTGLVDLGGFLKTPPLAGRLLAWQIFGGFCPLGGLVGGHFARTISLPKFQSLTKCSFQWILRENAKNAKNVDSLGDYQGILSLFKVNLGQWGNKEPVCTYVFDVFILFKRITQTKSYTSWVSPKNI